MVFTTSFEPVFNDKTRILILGSHPGVQSLAKQQYYGNPGNAFWRIVFTALAVEDPGDYSQRLDLLLENGLGLWDVYAQVEREGSLDTNIRNESLNQFERVLENSSIKLIIANGKTAYRETQKHEIFKEYEVVSVLSTSGLNNGREKERMEQWVRAIKRGLGRL